MKQELAIITAFVVHSITAFAPAPAQWQNRPQDSPHEDGSSSSSVFYTNNINEGEDWSSSEGLISHNAQPLPPQKLPSPFLSLLKTEEDWKEWHYSFSRNGFTDFLPQFASHISCLAIDVTKSATGKEPASAISENSSLPWQHSEDDTQAVTTDITNVKLTSTPDNVSLKLQRASQDDTVSIIKADEDGFDCILDGGILNGVVSSLPPTVTWHSRAAPTALLDLVKLMKEATDAIREFGIYVDITEAPIPEYAKGYLDSMGEVMGMEWSYDLDGLTKEGYSVSVARKHFTGLVNYKSTSSDAGSNNKKILKP